MPNIAFFSNHFARKSGTGIARYAHSLVRAFKELDDGCRVVPVATWSDREPQDLAAFQSATGLRLVRTGRWLSPLLWNTLGRPRIEELLDFPVDIVHTNTLGYLTATRKPFIFTIHDIGPLVVPEFFRNTYSSIMKMSLARAARHAAALVCVSQATADSVLEYSRRQYGLDLSDRTFVTPEGISDSFLQPADPSVLDREGFEFTRRPFILAVGRISPRKNLETVIRALHQLKDRIPHHLATVGGDGWDSEGVRKLVDELGLADRVHFLGYVSDAELNALYGRAGLFAYPSFFEGFGLPVLEAMACGCPVVTSNISSLPEVAGDAALLADPHRTADLAAAIEAVCTDPALADSLKQKGRQRAALFSWKKCAEQTSAVYKKFA